MIRRCRSTPDESALSWKRPMASNPNRRVSLYVFAFYVALLAAWQLLFSVGLIRDYLFPSPSHVAERLYELGKDGMLWPSIKATLGRMALGFTISAGIGLGLGLLMGTN